MRKYVSLKILRLIYCAILDPCLSYCCFFVWAQNCNIDQQIVVLQKALSELLIFNQEMSIPVPYSNKSPS